MIVRVLIARAVARLVGGRSVFELLQEIHQFQRRSSGLLKQVGTATMATFGVLKIEDRMILRCQLGHHSARMTGMNPIIPGIGPEEYLRIVNIRPDILIRRVFFDIGALFQNIRIAIFRHPTGAGGQLVIADHIKQRHGADDRSKKPGARYGPCTYQQTAIAAATNTQMFRTGIPFADEILCYCDEIIIGTLSLLKQGRLMPGWPPPPRDRLTRQRW